ncbi:hypothetical protein L195_g060738, partial [Trifolium pratense]
YTTPLRSNRGFNHLQRSQPPSTPVQSHSPGLHDHEVMGLLIALRWVNDLQIENVDFELD